MYEPLPLRPRLGRVDSANYTTPSTRDATARRACQGRFDIPAGSMETTIEVHGLKELERALSGVPRRLSDA